MPRALSRRARWRRYRWERPDWWVTLVAVGAWAVLVAAAAGSRIHPDGHHGHHHHVAPVPLSVAGDGNGWVTAMGWWSVMVAAMMLPLAVSDARWLAHRSLARRRNRTVVLHAMGFLAVWVLAGAVIVPAVQAAGAATAATAGALAAAAAWQVTPARRRALRRCGAGRAPAIRGFRADADCLHTGIRTGRRCLVTCGVAMVPMAATHNLVLMGAVALLGASERRRAPNPEERVGRPAEALGLAAVATAVAGAGAFGVV